MALHESGEDYLEAVLVLRQERGIVRSIDVAQHLGFSKPSVSRAVSILKASGYLTMEKDGRLELTPEGEQNAQRELQECMSSIELLRLSQTMLFYVVTEI